MGKSGRRGGVLSFLLDFPLIPTVCDTSCNEQLIASVSTMEAVEEVERKSVNWTWLNFWTPYGTPLLARRHNLGGGAYFYAP